MFLLGDDLKSPATTRIHNQSFVIQTLAAYPLLSGPGSIARPDAAGHGEVQAK